MTGVGFPGRALAVAVAIAATPLAAHAQTQLDSLVAAFARAQDVPGLAVAWVGPDGDDVVVYGTSCARGGSPITPVTAFEIGSLTKVFTGLLLAEMAVRGDVGPESPVAAVLHDSVRVPTFAGKEFTLGQLATHTSGLPRLPYNLRPADLSDPYAQYGAQDLIAFLAAYHLTNEPGVAYAYSNLAVGLLGFALGQQGGRPFDGMLRARVLDPLGLEGTHVPRPARDGEAGGVAPTACGHVDGNPVPYWYWDVLAGAGALRSTPGELLRFLRANIEPEGTGLADAIVRSHEVLARPAEHLAVAYGWHVSPFPGDPETGLRWHNGGTGGFRSFLGFSRDRGVGVAVLVNAALPLPVVDAFGLGLLRTIADAQGGVGSPQDAH